MNNCIVIGLGSMGASALFQLAKKGVNVLGIEQFKIGHDRGSHSGQTRIVRKAYFEHPRYVPLLEGAYKGWKEIEEVSGRKLFYKTGLCYLGEPDHTLMKGVKQSATQFDIELQYPQAKNDFSNFKMPLGFEAFTEPDAGFVLAEETIITYIEEAKKEGASVRTNETVLTWKLKDGVVTVLTDKNEYKAEKLIITAGAYVKHLLPELRNSLKISRQLISWVQPSKPELFELDNFPCWVIADKEYPGLFYGFPVLPTSKFGGNGLLKVAHHYRAEEADPETVQQFDAGREKSKLEKILKKYIPDALGSFEEITVCLYTNTPDENFIIDFLPESNQQIIFATGFSGHGFKFVPVMGEVLCDLAVLGSTNWPIGFLNLNRYRNVE